MPTYEVESDDLVEISGQLRVQSDQCGRASNGVQQSTATMLTAIRGGGVSAETTVTSLLDELSRAVWTATLSAAAADWTGLDSDRFRAADDDLTALITRSQERVGIAFTDHVAATEQVASVLDGMVTDFAAAANRAGQLSAELAAAVQAEADAYEAAFAGGFAATGPMVGSGPSAGSGAEAHVGAAATADSDESPHSPGLLGRLGRHFGIGVEKTKGFAEGVLEAGDNIIGKDRVNSDFEDQLLHRWLEGQGGTYELTGDQLATVTQAPVVQNVGTAIANHQTPTLPDGSTITLREVTLENGQHGYAAPVDFYSGVPGQVNSLDGSIGGATVYFNDRGEPVGIRDRYDFTNDNVAVDLTNLTGSLVGAHDFDVRGGVIER